MGAVTFTLSGSTEAEVKRQVSQKLQEARRQGLYEDRRSIIYDPRTGQYRAVLRVHT